MRLIFPKHKIREMKCEFLRIFKLDSLHTDGIFRLGFCGGMSVKVLILYLKHYEYVCVFLKRVSLAFILHALRGQVHSNR